MYSDDDLRKLLDDAANTEGIRPLAARLGVTAPLISINRPGNRIKRARKFSELLAERMGFVRAWVRKGD